MFLEEVDAERDSNEIAVTDGQPPVNGPKWISLIKMFNYSSELICFPGQGFYNAERPLGDSILVHFDTRYKRMNN